MKRMRMRKPFSKMEGLTLLETMFAIAVGALVLIGAIIFYMSTKQSANANKVVGDLNAIVAAYQNYIASGQQLVAGTTNITTLQGQNLLPSPLNTPWGQAYTDIVATTPASTTITIKGIGGTGDSNCTAILNLSGANSSTTTGTPTIISKTTDSSACVIEYLL